MTKSADYKAIRPRGLMRRLKLSQPGIQLIDHFRPVRIQVYGLANEFGLIVTPDYCIRQCYTFCQRFMPVDKCLYIPIAARQSQLFKQVIHSMS